jgi:hypothetical protein
MRRFSGAAENSRGQPAGSRSGVDAAHTPTGFLACLSVRQRAVCDSDALHGRGAAPGHSVGPGWPRLRSWKHPDPMRHLDVFCVKRAAEPRQLSIGYMRLVLVLCESPASRGHTTQTRRCNTTMSDMQEPDVFVSIGTKRPGFRTMLCV